MGSCSLWGAGGEIHSLNGKVSLMENGRFEQRLED